MLKYFNHEANLQSAQNRWDFFAYSSFCESKMNLEYISIRKLIIRQKWNCPLNRFPNTDRM